MSTQVTSGPITGTWVSDPTHSSFSFSVRHMIVATFRGALPDFEATVTAGPEGELQLVGVGRPASVTTQDENLTGHLSSPDFFDVQRYPEVRYESTRVERDGERVTVEGRLTLKGVTHELSLHGALVGPVEALGGEVIGLQLEGVIDRTQYGLNWNAPLPGGGWAVGNDVTLRAELELRPLASS